jgi:hypothetical protein
LPWPLTGSRLGVEDAETPAKVVGIYRINTDGSIEPLGSVHVGAGEQASMFFTYEGVVVVIAPERPASAAGG